MLLGSSWAVAKSIQQFVVRFLVFTSDISKAWAFAPSEWPALFDRFWTHVHLGLSAGDTLGHPISDKHTFDQAPLAAGCWRHAADCRTRALGAITQRPVGCERGWGGSVSVVSEFENPQILCFSVEAFHYWIQLNSKLILNTWNHKVHHLFEVKIRPSV